MAASRCRYWRTGYGEPRPRSQRVGIRGFTPPPWSCPSTRMVGASVPRRNARSLAGTRAANMSCKCAGDGDLGHRLGQRAVADHEAGGAAAVIAGHAVDAHADQFGDVKPFLDVRHQLGRAQRAGRGGTGCSSPARAARRCRGWHGRWCSGQAGGRCGCPAARSSARRPRPAAARRVGTPSPSNGRERRPRRRRGSSMMSMPGGEDAAAHAVLAGSWCRAPPPRR